MSFASSSRNKKIVHVIKSIMTSRRIQERLQTRPDFEEESKKTEEFLNKYFSERDASGCRIYGSWSGSFFFSGRDIEIIKTWIAHQLNMFREQETKFIMEETLLKSQEILKTAQDRTTFLSDMLRQFVVD